MALILAVWTVPAGAQIPAGEDAASLLERGRRAASQYVRSLPDFLCLETIERYSDPDARGNWYLGDTLTLKLSYFEQKEEHQLVLIDGKPTDRTYDSLDGALGVGQFGGILQNIFNPSSAASFHFETDRDLRGHAVAEYSYSVDVSRSHYTLKFGLPGGLHSATVGYHGLVDVDRETAAVLHLTHEADHIPPDLGLDSTVTMVDFDFADIAGQPYLLPSAAKTEMHTPKLWARNDISFRQYAKFSSESTLHFGAGK